jgi:hypothetical protein
MVSFAGFTAAELVDTETVVFIGTGIVLLELDAVGVADTGTAASTRLIPKSIVNI